MKSTYKRNRTFSNYGQYSMVKPTVEYVAMETTEDLRSREIASARQKLEAARDRNNQFQVRLFENELERLCR